MKNNTYKTFILSIDYKGKYGNLLDYLIENEDVGKVSKQSRL